MRSQTLKKMPNFAYEHGGVLQRQSQILILCFTNPARSLFPHLKQKCESQSCDAKKAGSLLYEWLKIYKN